jgi:16S rRNA (cytosine967-C5)-methyltransferase
MKSLPSSPSVDVWSVTVTLVERWLGRRGRVDALMEEAGRRTAGAGRGEGKSTVPAPGAPFDSAQDRARCQHLLYGVVRNFGRLNDAIAAMVARTPRARLQAVLLVGALELFEAGVAPAGQGRAARIVHHAVERAKNLLSPAEARLVNAVLRKLAAAADVGEAPPVGAEAGELARFYSHPEWLVRRWLAHFGAGATQSLLAWNQTPAPVHARWRGPGSPPGWLGATPWPEFFEVPSGHWPEIEPLVSAGRLYLQDPSTMLAVDLLDPQPGETVLDLCAAPGGKSLLLADLLETRAHQAGLAEKRGRVVAVDLPDERRVGRLKENLAKARTTDVALVQADVRRLSSRLLKEHRLPTAYDAILLDAPCSNTGVIRRRVDVKWRLRETDIARHATQKRALLAAAARFVTGPGAAVRLGGRLIYSTCSLEPEENEGVIEAFLRASGGRFALEQSGHRRPWESGCDGAGAFRLRRNA